MSACSVCGAGGFDQSDLETHVKLAHPAVYQARAFDVTKLKEGRKDDQEKPRWDLLPYAGAEEVVKVLTYGAKKYAPENWRKVEGWRWRYFAAAIRHLARWRVGEKLDPESGLPHLAHAACCILFMLELDT